MDGSLSLVAASASEPVTPQEAKDWCRGPSAADDPLITSLTTTARRYVEKMTSRALLTQTWDYFLDAFPCWAIPLPRGTPLQSITTVKYTDPSTGNQLTLGSSLYVANLRKEPAIIVPSYGNVWPTTRTVENAVEIRFVAGYVGAVPEELKQAIKVLVAKMYEAREAVEEPARKDVPLAFWNLINEYRLWWI
jgi:uncharacterized phiE125 gp8 family phage protein